MCAIIGFDSPTLTEQEIRPYFDRTISRGPDMSRMEKAGRGMLGFHRTFRFQTSHLSGNRLSA